MSEAHSYRLTALPSRPNRVLPIGTIAEGKHKGEPHLVHVHTGSTRVVAAADEPALREHLEAEGIAADYQLVPLVRTRRGGRRRGRFAPPEQAPRSTPSSSSSKGRTRTKATEAQAAETKAAEAKGSGG